MNRPTWPVQCGVRGCGGAVSECHESTYLKVTCKNKSYHEGYLTQIDGKEGFEFTTRGVKHLKGKLLPAGRRVPKMCVRKSFHIDMHTHTDKHITQACLHFFLFGTPHAHHTPIGTSKASKSTVAELPPVEEVAPKKADKQAGVLSVLSVLVSWRSKCSK